MKIPWECEMDTHKNTQEQSTPQTPQPPRPPRVLLTRWKRPAAWLAGGLVLVGGLGFGAVPLLRGVVETQLASALHRPVSIGSLAFNPYTLNLTVRELRVLEPQGQTEALGFDALEVNLEAESLLRGGVVLEHLSLQGPRLHFVRQSDGRYNWSDLIDEILNKPDDGSKSSFALHNIRIQGGALSFEDQPAGRTHQITGLELGLPFVSNLPSWVDSFVEPRLSLAFNGNPIVLQAQAKPFASGRPARLHLDLQGLPLADYLGYLPFKPTFELADGRLSLQLDLDFAQPEGQTPQIQRPSQGAVEFTRLGLRHPAASPPWPWRRCIWGWRMCAPWIESWPFPGWKFASPSCMLHAINTGVAACSICSRPRPRRPPPHLRPRPPPSPSPWP